MEARSLFEGLKRGKIEALNTGKRMRLPEILSLGKELAGLMEKEGMKPLALLPIWKEGGRNGRLIAIAALERMCRTDHWAVEGFVLEVLGDLSDWESCDQLALRVIRNLMLQDEVGTRSLLKLCIGQENRWVRRLAVATIPPYVRAKGEDAVPFCLELLGEVMEDPQLTKAVGWALRELSKKDPDRVFRFLKSWTSSPKARKAVLEGMRKLPEAHQRILRGSMNHD